MLKPRSSPGASVAPIVNGWHLEIPAGTAGSYRLAQLDDYVGLSRGRFPLRSPTILSLRCRVSEPNLPGTWGFGFWNDPFAFSLGLQGTIRRLPALPNACWFFHASPENYLSFRSKSDGKHAFSGNGFLAQTFRSPKIPTWLLAPGVLGLPLLLAKTTSKQLRAAIGKIIGEDSVPLSVDVTQWHSYSLAWRASSVTFKIDEAVVFESPICPRGPLGTVIWIDNQFAAWTPEGKIGFGTLQNEATGWMEVERVEIE